jgi:hypothetical protein
MSSVKKSNKIYLLRVGPGPDNLSELTEQTFNDLLDSCNEHWWQKDYTLVFPLFPGPKYIGPTGLNVDFVSEKLDRGREGQVIGDFSELKVLRMFETISQSKNLGLKLFSGIKFNKSNLLQLASVFNFDVRNLDSDFPEVKDLETDLICIHKGAICLAEVKSKSNSEKLWVRKSFDVDQSYYNLVFLNSLIFGKCFKLNLCVPIY